MKVSDTILTHIHNSLQDTKDGEAGEKAKELATHYGVSTQTIYAWAKKKGLRWRKERATKGQTKVSDDVLNKVATLLYSSRRKSNEIPLPACDAVEMLVDSNIYSGEVSTGRILGLLREKRLSARDLLQPSPHQLLLSKHPNHVWQFDVTNCFQYFLDDKGMGERDANLKLGKNQIVKTAKTIKKELLRYVAVDHCTGAFYVRYFYASGELAIHGSQFLLEAMRPKDELIAKVFNGSAKAKQGKYHFHGVPYMLVADRGSIMAAKANQGLFDALRVEVNTHLPGNPRAKGAVEGMMKIINRFDARLKFMRSANLEELNCWVLDWCIMFNAIKNMRDVAPRSALWSMITPEQLRLCPDEKVYRLLIREPVKKCRADGARIINLDGNAYQVPDVMAANQYINVIRHPYEYPAVEAHYNGYVWLLQPIPRDQFGRLTVGVEYGEYKALKNTETQNAKKEFEKIAEGWGLKWKGTGDKRIAVAPPAGTESPLQVFGHQADKVGNVAFINRKGTELEIKQPEMPVNKPVQADAQQIDRGMSSRRISFTEFLKRLVQEVGAITPELNQQLRAEYGDSIEIKKAEEVINELRMTKDEGRRTKEREAAAG